MNECSTMNQGWHESVNKKMNFYPSRFNIQRIAHQLRLNLIAKSYAHNNERCSKDVAHNNNNKEQEQKTVNKGTKDKRKQEHTAQDNNQHEIL